MNRVPKDLELKPNQVSKNGLVKTKSGEIIKLKEVWENLRIKVKQLAHSYSAASTSSSTPPQIAQANWNYHNAPQNNPILSYIISQEDTKTPSLPTKLVFTRAIHPSWLRAFIEAIAGVPDIFGGVTTLVLAGSSLGDLGVEVLSQCLPRLPSVRWVDLSSCMISSQGCTHLATLLARTRTHTPTLLSLTLDYNAIGDTGAACLASGLMKNETLKQLSLSHCGLTEKAVTNISAVLSSPSSALNDLNLSDNRLGSHACCTLLQSMWIHKRIQVINLEGTSFTNVFQTAEHKVREIKYQEVEEEEKEDDVPLDLVHHDDDDEDEDGEKKKEKKEEKQEKKEEKEEKSEEGGNGNNVDDVNNVDQSQLTTDTDTAPSTTQPPSGGGDMVDDGDLSLLPSELHSIATLIFTMHKCPLLYSINIAANKLTNIALRLILDNVGSLTNVYIFHTDLNVDPVMYKDLLAWLALNKPVKKTKKIKKKVEKRW